MALTYHLQIGDTTREAEVQYTDEGLQVKLDDTWYNVQVERIGEGEFFSLIIDGQSWEASAVDTSTGFDLIIGPYVYPVAVGGMKTARKGSGGGAGADGTWVLTSPMSGVVVDVYVAEGDDVEQGAVLMVLEAMKMNNELQSQKTGTVQTVHVSKGDRVDRGTPLITVS
jgi:biotin carboxyl carrier protein